MKRILILLFFSPSLIFAQKTNVFEEGLGREICKSYAKNYTSESKADEALNKILSTIGASKRFVIQSCENIDNAMAITVSGIRYIYYNPDFMEKINSKTNYWSNMSILAHEVGHHINGHTVDALLIEEAYREETLKESRKIELEADEFSGFVLGKLGASLDQASKLIKSLPDNEDDIYSTHPSKAKRLNAIKIGFDKAKEDKIIYQKNSQNSSNDYFYIAFDKAEKKDYYGAIADYTKAIEINPKFAKAYVNRGIAKENLGDLKGACLDWKKSVSLGLQDANSWIINQCR